MRQRTWEQERVIDIHAHVLPEVDDGSGSMEETLQMLQIAQEEGITDIIATPHYQSGRFYTPADMVMEILLEVQDRAEEAGIGIRLYPGTEIYFRSGLEERLEGGQLATMNGGNRILVEFGPMEEFSYIRNAMEELCGIGYVPILAHVERFRCMLEKASRVGELRGMGCEIQANAGSISGKYGFRIRKYLQGLLEERMIDYVGTDAHDTAGRAPYIKKCIDFLYKKFDADYVEAVLYRNAERNLLEKEEL